MKQSTIHSLFKKAGFVRQDKPPQPTDSETSTVEAADITELWEHVTTDRDTRGVSLEEFLIADSAASFCDH